jgi:2-dehydro-3-deoxygluconokinase
MNAPHRPAIACFGELLLRLNAPGRELLLQSRQLDVHVGGAEANVAVALAQLGDDVRFVGVAPDGPLGDAAVGELRRYGVDVARIRRADGRMGLYFMTAGAVRRQSEILYDRAGSAFAETEPAVYDWNQLLDGCAWLHVSGVTPAVGSKAADAALNAAEVARARGVKLSFDGNYRGQMWARWSNDGPAILRRLIAGATLAFVNEKDIALILGDAALGEKTARPAAFAAAFAAFPTLQIIAATTREQTSVDDHRLAAEIVTRNDRVVAGPVDLPNVVDRIGGGDAFAAGVLHVLCNGGGAGRALDFGVAAATIKHSIPGDFLIADAADIEAAMSSEAFDVRR